MAKVKDELTVEPAPGVDVEGLDVVKDCLDEVFRLSASPVDAQIQPGLLVNLFRSADAAKQHDDAAPAAMSVDTPCTTSAPTNVNGNHSETSKSLFGDNDEWTGGVSKDELYGQFCGALERIHFFNATSDGDDHVQLAKAKHLFDEAYVPKAGVAKKTEPEMEKSGCQEATLSNLAESLKSRGNHAMQSKMYSDAVDLYTCAIAICKNNAVYYCNSNKRGGGSTNITSLYKARYHIDLLAAGYTQLHKYSEAISDCNRSIEIDPNYSKAYSRLGLAYYAQGNYSNAINKGFLKALQLDPNSTTIRENIRVAEQKLKEELQQQERNQNAGPSQTQEPNSQSEGSTRSRGPAAFSMPFGAGLPSDFTNIIMNMAANAQQGQHARDGPQNGNTEGPVEPEVRIDGNISLNFDEEMPADLSGTLRSVMEMFTSSHASRGDTQRDSTSN
ncbi:hypothetical protein ACLOJK_001176 [Asimina triloba]